MALIETRDLARHYTLGDQVVTALAGVSVDVESGEFVAVMGPSGSGKSTFMNLVGCLDRPTAGRYVLDGEEISALGADGLATIRNRKIGFVFQQFNLLDRQDALANVELPMVYAGLARRERRRRAQEALERVGLGERVHHLPTQLSGGQQQRVACARALVSRPELIFGDEPTGNLDSNASREVLDILRTAVDEDGQTVVIVTHDARAASYADRVVFLRDGNIVDEMRDPDMDAILRVMAGMED